MGARTRHVDMVAPGDTWATVEGAAQDVATAFALISSDRWMASILLCIKILDQRSSTSEPGVTGIRGIAPPPQVAQSSTRARPAAIVWSTGAISPKLVAKSFPTP
jgi:hypothetical protein